MAEFYVATEDALSQAIAERIVIEAGHSVAGFIPKDRRRHGGFGYLKTRLPDFVRSSQGGIPFFVLTDLDTAKCPPELIDDWCGEMVRPANLFLRIAVREAEAWVLADRSAFATWLKIDVAKLPRAPESEAEPKEKLLALAGSSGNREIREGLISKAGAVARQGLRYNDLLSEFVRTHWRHENAAESSPSLRRAIERLRHYR